MSLTREGKEYLNGKESAPFLEISFSTFQDIEQKHQLPRKKFVGKGRAVFYLKSDLERVKNTPLEE